MPAKKKEGSESHAIAVIDEALDGLPDDESRARVLSWAAAKYGRSMRINTGTSGGVAALQSAGSVQMDFEGGDTHGPRTKAWVKKHGITAKALDSAFHIDGETSTLILKTIPGSSKRERLRNIAALLGALSLVKTDQPKFTSAEFREALKQYDAYDSANGPTYVKAHNDVIQGGASGGYTVTSIGLDLAANLLVQPAVE